MATEIAAVDRPEDLSLDDVLSDWEAIAAEIRRGGNVRFEAQEDEEGNERIVALSD